MMRDAALARRDRRAASTTCWSTSTRTPTALQAEILLRAEARRPRRHGGGRRRAGDLLVPRRHGRATSSSFPERFSPPARVVVLEENYRSTQPVLDAANAVIGRRRAAVPQVPAQHARRRRAAALRDGAGRARRRPATWSSAVLECRERGVDAASRQAVLFRNADHSDVLELELMRRNIPYVKYGGLKFLEAAHVKDLLAVLRWADNPRNRIAGVPRAAAAARHGAGARAARLRRVRGRRASAGRRSRRIPCRRARASTGRRSPR
ncbi:MAG: hypothetical protein MZW92_53880 [Comamonadaceae bacterium]|nr:hypothetical protein [Comamonadaceae bacterium]